ncbi:MAG: response regulator transcription factor [Candidatus Nanopelagicales bacterium]
MSRLLIVEDDLQMQRALTLTLSARGFQVTAASTGAEALRILAQQRADAIVLDLGLPDMDGIEVLRAVRQDSSVPVLVLSARSDRFEKVRALDSGADDYVTKPFDLEELLARIRAAVRRATPAIGAPRVTTDDFEVDLARKHVTLRDGQQVHLTPTEWALLEVLVRQPGVVVAGQDLLGEVWGPAYGRETNYLRVYMAGLRKKLEPDPAHPRHLLTSPGIGYRFEL